MWNNHKPNMQQPMKSHVWKVPSLWQKMNHTSPFIQLVTTNINPKLNLYSSPPPHKSHSLSHIKNLQNIPHFIMIKLTQSLSPIQTL